MQNAWDRIDTEAIYQPDNVKGSFHFNERGVDEQPFN
jgi:hypothetical protein